MLVVDNLRSGFDVIELYGAEAKVWHRRLRTREVQHDTPSKIVFAENNRLLVGGSNHGLIYLFDTRTGRKLGTLRHRRSDCVQVVAVSSLTARRFPS